MHVFCLTLDICMSHLFEPHESLDPGYKDDQIYVFQLQKNALRRLIKPAV